jgi:hypothetical protein
MDDVWYQVVVDIERNRLELWICGLLRRIIETFFDEWQRGILFVTGE